MPVVIQEHHTAHERTPFLLADSGELDSPTMSAPPSPTNSRRISNVRKYNSHLLPNSSDLTARIVSAKDEGVPDERSPLLTHRRSRTRIQEGGETPMRRLSRHHSATGPHPQS